MTNTMGQIPAACSGKGNDDSSLCAASRQAMKCKYRIIVAIMATAARDAPGPGPVPRGFPNFTIPLSPFLAIRRAQGSWALWNVGEL